MNLHSSECDLIKILKCKRQTTEYLEKREGLSRNRTGYANRWYDEEQRDAEEIC